MRAVVLMLAFNVQKLTGNSVQELLEKMAS